MGLLKIHGGKSYLAKKILEHFPPRGSWHLYREPFFGGGAVLFQLDPQGISEAVNDLDGDLIRFWRVLQQPETFLRFRRRLQAIPLSQFHFQQAWRTLQQPFSPEKYSAALTLQDIDRAVQFFILARQSRQGLRKDYATPTRRIRRGMNENVSAWLSAVEGLSEVHERLKRVEICCMDALAFLLRYDDPEAVFYCDPPYLPETRTVRNAYTYEMSVPQHQALLETLSRLQGKFLLSGYRSDLYDAFAEKYGWRRVEFEIDNKAASGPSKRKMCEALWMNF